MCHVLRKEPSRHSLDGAVIQRTTRAKQEQLAPTANTLQRNSVCKPHVTVQSAGTIQ